MLRIAVFLRGHSGSTAIEYALIAGGVALAIIAGISLLGDGLVGSYTATTSAISGAN